MPRKKTNSHLPKSKGMDTATVYSPEECKQKVKRIVLQETNKQIVDESATNLQEVGHSEENESMIQSGVKLLKGCSYADIEQIILKAKRKVIIENSSMTYEISL